MKSLGQIFIILILVLSVVFMSLMVSVYATHKNWKKDTDAAKAQLTKAQGELTAAKNKFENDKNTLEQERDQLKTSITQLTQKISELTADNTKLNAARADLENKQASVITSIKAVHDTMAKSREEMVNTRTLFRTSQRVFAEKLTELAKKSEEAQELTLTLATVKDISTDLLKQYADAVDVLRKHELKPDPQLYSGTPPVVEGLITDVRPGNGGNSMVEISIGEDDGLLKGHQLYVYRTVNGRSSLLGKIEVVALEPNKAACKVLADYRQGNIQRDDNVTSKLN